MIEWFKRQSASTKVMIGIIIVSILGIIINWKNVSTEASEAVNSRIERLMGDTK